MSRASLQITSILVNDLATDTAFNGEQNLGENPAFDLIGLTQLRNDPQFAGIDGSGFSVAVIDTGLDIEHPLIAPNYVAGYDFIDRDDNPNDPVGHGTHIAGKIGAIDEEIGVATDAGLIALRALDSNGKAFVSKIEAALKWVYDNRLEYNITAVNLSLGTGFYTPESQVQGDILSDDIQRLEAAGVTVVAAAGNEYFTNENSEDSTGIAFPAVFSTIAVGAVWQDDSEPLTVWQDGSIDYSSGADRIPGFSQRADTENFIFAPGAIITSTLPNNRLGRNAGTSQAVPHIAGTVALLQEASLQFSDRILTPAEVNELLRSTGDIIFDGDDEDENVTNTDTSYLRVNVYNAVSEIKRRADATNLSTRVGLNDIISQIERETSFPVSDRIGKIGRDGTHYVGSRDVDFYLFNPDEAGVLEIDVKSQASNPLNTVISLFDRQGKRLAEEDNRDSNDSNLRFEVDADTNYYLAITGFGNQDFDPFTIGSSTGGDTGIYSLSAELLTSANQTSVTNNTLASLEPENAVYQFHHRDTGTNFYTASTVERDFIRDNLSQYSLTGVPFESADPLSGAKPVYRLFNSDTGRHLYTISEAEKDLIEDNLLNYKSDGVVYYGYEEQQPGTTPLYRLYNTSSHSHFFTSSTAEKNEILASGDYRLEGKKGVAFYVESRDI